MKQKNIYLNFKEKTQKEFNDFPAFWAFSDEQLEEGLKKLNTKKEELLSIGGGGFIRKTDKEAFLNMLKNHDEKFKEMLKDETFLFKAFLYELANHEFCITLDEEETLNCLGLEYNKLTKKQLIILEKAKIEYLNKVEDY